MSVKIFYLVYCMQYTNIYRFHKTIYIPNICFAKFQIYNELNQYAKNREPYGFNENKVGIMVCSVKMNLNAILSI